jgi:hypothetical protein
VWSGGGPLVWSAVGPRPLGVGVRETNVPPAIGKWQAGDLRASEVLITMGGRYSLTWWPPGKQKPPEARHVAYRGVLSPAGIDSLDQCHHVWRPNRFPFLDPCGDGRGAQVWLGTSIAAGELAIVSQELITL